VTGSTTGGAGEPANVHTQLTWTLPAAFNLAPGAAAKTFSFSVRAASVEPGDSFSNTATVSGGGATEPDATLGDNTSTSGSTTVRDATVTGYKLYLPLVVK
jgi:hypothetical protein